MTKHSKIERGYAADVGKMPPMTGVAIGLALCLPFWMIVAAVLT